MDKAPLISICIPAYRRINFLKRLLDSISIQHLRSYEIVITDDSPDDQVKNLVSSHQLAPAILYIKNQTTLGTPENWNESIRHATGEWIKLMHDDDWFAGPDSLDVFAREIEKNQSSFIFSAFTNVSPKGHLKQVNTGSSGARRIAKIPELLLVSNIIGPPSVVIFKRDERVDFDRRLQWLVDIDFYIRYLTLHQSITFIKSSLVNIGLSDSQVTQSSFGNPKIEIPERFLVAGNFGNSHFRNLRMYDGWWRFIRNLKIHNETQIAEHGFKGTIPAEVSSMIKFQRKIPPVLIRNPFLSKMLMLLHYYRPGR